MTPRALLRSPRFRLLLLAFLLVAIVLPWPTHGADCSSSPLPPRLAAGGVARVSYEAGIAAAIRTFPGNDARMIGNVPGGSPLNILRGPTCSEGIHWFRVATLGGLVGWTAESAPEFGYQLEPWQILLDTAQKTPTGFEIVRVNDRGQQSVLTAYPIPKLAGTIGQLWPPQEHAPLDDALRVGLAVCPERIFMLNPDYTGRVTLVDVASDTGLYSAYPSPDAARLILVRHLWRSVVGCGGTLSNIHGIDRVSLLIGKTEHLLFDIPANARLPGLARQDDAYNRVIDVVWSPDNLRAAAWVQYGERPRLLVINTREGTVTTLDDGMFPTWLPDGDKLAWLRIDGSLTNLIIARPDNTARQTVALPDTLQYFGARFDPQWTPNATALIACSQADRCATIIPIDINRRRALPPIVVPSNAQGVIWVRAGEALLWIPKQGGDFTLEFLSGIRQSIFLTLGPGERVIGAIAFPGGRSALVQLQTAENSVRYAVLPINTKSDETDS